MEDVSPEVIWTILQKLDYNTILIYCQTCKWAVEILRSNAFWVQKIRFDIISRYDIESSNNFVNTTLDPDQRYLQIFTENLGVACGSERFVNPRYLMRRAIRKGRIDIEKYLINRGFNDWSLILEEYATINDRKSIDYYLQLLDNYDIVAYGALIGGHKDLFDSIKLLVRDNHEWNWDLLASAALQSGNTDIFEYILLLMPEQYELNWQKLCEVSILLENRDLFDYIRFLVPNYTFNFTRLGLIAASINDLEFFEYVRSLTLFTKYNWQAWSYGAIESGNQDIFDHIWLLGNKNWEYDWNKLASIALLHNHRFLFNYIYVMAPRNYSFSWNRLLRSAINSRNPYLVKYLISLAPENQIIDWSEVLLVTMELKCKILFNKILELVPDQIILNWPDINRRSSNSLGEFLS